MRRVVIDMQNYLFADAIANALKNKDSDFDVYRKQEHDQTADCCRLINPNALLMEVTGSASFRFEERMKIRNEVKREEPECRIVLIVDENAEQQQAAEVLQAKKDGLIDQFIYSSVSSTYLSAIIDAL